MDASAANTPGSPIWNELLNLLQLEKIEKDLYRGQSQDLGYGTLFGGHVVAQALAAASRTSDRRHQAHSLHCYFLLPGDTRLPIVYRVDRIRDGKSFSTRRVTALQNGRPIFCMSASFHKEEPGFDHAKPAPDAGTPEATLRRDMTPEQVSLTNGLHPSLMDRPPFKGLFTPKPIEFRMADPDPLSPSEARPPKHHLWLRPAGSPPRDGALARAVLAYATDFYLVGTCLRPHAKSYWSPDMMVASIDHTVWFHRDFTMDDWLLYTMESPSASGGRGLSLGRIYTRDGQLVASVAQEGLLRRLHLTPDLLHPRPDLTESDPAYSDLL